MKNKQDYIKWRDEFFEKFNRKKVYQEWRYERFKEKFLNAIKRAYDPSIKPLYDTYLESEAILKSFINLPIIQECSYGYSLKSVEEKRIYHREWRKNNPEKCRAYVKKYQAKKRLQNKKESV